MCVVPPHLDRNLQEVGILPVSQSLSTVWCGCFLVIDIVCCAVHLCVICQLFWWYSYIS